MFEAILLGLIHGATTFLPVSALVHRTVIGVLLGFAPPTLAREAGLELGALVAACLFFGLDWLQMLANGVGWRVGRDPELRRVPGAAWMLLGASVPLALGGYFLARESPTLSNPLVAGLLLVAVGLAMGWAETAARRQKTADHLTFADAMLMGLVQTLAVLPGASRMAVTLTAGMLLNFDRAAAVRLSYLMSVPVIAGRALLLMRRLAENGGLGEEEVLPFIAAALACAIAGCATIAFFTEYMRQGTLRPIVRYRVVFGIIVIALALLLR